MSGKLQNVVVVAGSGNLGPAVIQELLNAGLTVTATTRQESNAKFAEGVKVVKTDYSKDSLVSIFKGQDAVLSLAGGSHLTDQIGYVDAAVEAGVKRFFPSEFGGDTRDPALTKALPIFGQKQQVVAHLKSKESSNFSWTGVVSGAFFDWGLQAGFLGFDLKNKTVKLFDDGSAVFTTSTLSTIGKAIVSILTKPEVAAATANQYIGISTAAISQNDILAAAEEASGAKWTVNQVNSVEYRKGSEAEVAKGNYEAFYGILQSYLFGKSENNVADLRNTEVGIWNDKLGLSPENYKDVVKSVVSK